MDPVGPAVRELRSRSGRDGLLELRFARRGAESVLVHRRFRTPLQVLDTLTFPGDPAVGALILNPTGGVLGGDRLATELDLGPGTHVVVSTPSATRAYGSRTETSALVTAARVAEGATLEYVPDHLIPHPGARIVQELRIDLVADARLLLWDAWSLGRPARGELWSFATLSNLVRVSRDGGPLLIDRVALTPESRGLAATGGSEGRAYVASWLVAGGATRDWAALSDTLARAVGAIPGVLGSCGTLGGGGCLVRLLAASAHALTDAQRRLWDDSRAALLGLGPLDLRKS